jgi:hypothetical protein
MTTGQREDRLLSGGWPRENCIRNPICSVARAAARQSVSGVLRESPFGYLAMGWSTACIFIKLWLVDPGDVAAGNSGNTDKPFG